MKSARHDRGAGKAKAALQAILSAVRASLRDDD